MNGYGLACLMLTVCKMGWREGYFFCCLFKKWKWV